MYKIVIKKTASRDAQRAFDYYEEKSPGLGERFITQLQLVYTSLSLYPTYFGFIDEKKILRDKLLRIFPYAVIYKIEGENVIVVAIHNCYQHPGKRYRRV